MKWIISSKYVIVTIALGCGFLAVRPQSAGAESTEGNSISVNVSGLALRIPVAYLPPEDRMMLKSKRSTDAIGLDVSLPDMRPYTMPSDDRPSYIRNKDRMSILIDPYGGTLEQRQQAHFRKYANLWLKDRKEVGTRAGLKRYVLPSGARSPFGDDEVYLEADAGMDNTMIVCTKQSQPDPESAEAERLRAAGRLVWNPRCKQTFFLKGMDTVLIQVTYDRRHVDDWRLIREGVSHLLHGMMEKQQ